MLAGVLPAWAEGGSEERKGPEKECAAALNASADSAVRTLTEWHQSAKAGLHFAKQREQHRGLLQLTIRAWREHVEHATPQLQNAPTKWKVRRPSRQSAATPSPAQSSAQNSQVLGVLVNAQNSALQTAETLDQALTRRRREDWTDLHVKARRWNPWGAPAPTLPTDAQGQNDETPRPPDQQHLCALKRWMLRDKCLRVATYYRVMHLHSRARRAVTLRRLRQRFASWALSFVRHTQHSARQTAHNNHTSDLRTTRQGRVSANTHMHMHSVDLYRESRRNAPRRPRAQRNQSRGRTRLPTSTDTEIGSLLYDNMCIIASRFLSWLTRNPG